MLRVNQMSYQLRTATISTEKWLTYSSILPIVLVRKFIQEVTVVTGHQEYELFRVRLFLRIFRFQLWVRIQFSMLSCTEPRQRQGDSRSPTPRISITHSL